MNEPLVSIIIQTYNRKELLEDALKSATEQTYRNIEILIGDNHSEDETEEFCLNASAKDSRIKYFRHAENIGMVGNANFLLDKLEGEYFIFLNDDDWLDKYYVEKCIDFYKKNSNYSIVSPYTVVYPNNHKISSKKPGCKCIMVDLSSKNVYTRLKKYTRNQDNLQMSSGCFKTSVLRSIKQAEGQYIIDRYNEDIILIMKFLASGKGKMLKNTQLNKRDGGLSKDIKTSHLVYKSGKLSLKNVPMRRCHIFSSAIKKDKFFKTLFSEQELRKLSSRIYNSLQLHYKLGVWSWLNIFGRVFRTIKLLYNFRLYRQ